MDKKVVEIFKKDDEMKDIKVTFKKKDITSKIAKIEVIYEEQVKSKAELIESA